MMKFLALNSFGIGRANLPVSPNLNAGCKVQIAMLSAEFVVRLLSAEISRQCGSTALQKTIRHSLIAIRCHFLDIPLTPSHNTGRGEGLDE